MISESLAYSAWNPPEPVADESMPARRRARPGRPPGGPGIWPGPGPESESGPHHDHELAAAAAAAALAAAALGHHDVSNASLLVTSPAVGPVPAGPGPHWAAAAASPGAGRSGGGDPPSPPAVPGGWP
jgi:hypothetical protein